MQVRKGEKLCFIQAKVAKRPLLEFEISKSKLLTAWIPEYVVLGGVFQSKTNLESTISPLGLGCFSRVTDLQGRDAHRAPPTMVVSPGV
ncbi:hypothetical protein BDV10DRAFT_3480 [Aspergillus recurvatus]